MGDKNGGELLAAACCDWWDSTLLDNVPAAIVACGLDGTILRYNRKAAELFGGKLGSGQRFDQAVPFHRSDGKPIGEAGLMAEALRSGRSQRDVDLVLDQPTGRRIGVMANVEPTSGEAGVATGAIACFTDITASGQQKQAQEYANRLASIVEFSDDAIVSKDLNGVINSWNAGAQRLFGYTADEAIGKSITMLIPPERLDEEPGILDRIRRGERIDHYETVRMRKDGSLIDISLTVSPLKNADGIIIGASKIARDVSDRKREEERRKLLINELNHRVKNTLTSVQSISAQTFRGDSGGQAKDFEKRLVALGRAHDILTRESWEGADLRELASEVIAPLCLDFGNRIGMLGPPLRVRPKIALSLCMAIHELCTNAMKHGALAAGQGRVALEWSVLSSAGERRLRIRWEESGGSAVKPPSHTGFGTKLLQRAVARELGAQVQLQFLSTGVVCEIEAPLQ